MYFGPKFFNLALCDVSWCKDFFNRDREKLLVRCESPEIRHTVSGMVDAVWAKIMSIAQDGSIALLMTQEMSDLTSFLCRVKKEIK